MISRLKRIRRGIRWLWAWVTGSPLATYRAVCRRRDWVLAKIEYINAESARWRTAFGIL